MDRKLNCIMLIDDDEPTNFLSSLIIEEAGCARHVQVEDSGEKALNYLTNSKEQLFNDKTCPWPDLILLDINMPAMNGWEFLEKYTELGKEMAGKMVIVMLTTSLNPDDKSKAESIAAVAGFEVKPLTTELLHTIIRKYVPAYNNKLKLLLP